VISRQSFDASFANFAWIAAAKNCVAKYRTGIGKIMISVSKTLSAVEASPLASNQHELNGVSQFKKIFGLNEFRCTAEFRYANGAIAAHAGITWYDSRDAHPTRSEYRLYFQTNAVMDAAKEGDRVTITLTNAGDIIVDVLP
jgi:hypothetical protein